ncbi:MAG: hypothetical protein WBM44_10450 [Waterburya sp.]
MHQNFSTSEAAYTVAQVEANPSLPEIPVTKPGAGVSGEILAIIMAMSIFGVVVKKLTI